MAYKRVVIIGGGFGGLTAARSIHHAEVTLIDRTNHHLFQPLLYQVATTALSPGDIAWPLRTLFRSQRNVRVMMDDVVSLDRAARMVHLQNGSPIAFDILIVASGSRHAYFGHDEWESSAPGLKTMTDAVQLREKMLLAFEDAERRRTSTGVRSQLTFVIVGGGPTGVELAGALAELGRKTMGPDFPSLRLEDFSIILVEAGSRILPAFDAQLSAKAAAALTRMGVMIKLGSPVSAIHADGVRVGQEWIPSTNVIWAAGNQASPLLNTLSAPQDSFGRIKVRPDLTIPEDPWIFVIGDAAHCVGHNEKPLPGVAPVAIQQGRYVADLIDQDVAPDQRPLFAYADRGMLATIGRAQAVAQFGSVRASGLAAWLLWCVVHIFFLISFRSRFRVMSEWVWYYLTFKPGARLIFVQSAISHNRPSTDHAHK
ncbi:NAD(P)/FAD-dependent oxidoreductase [Candidatus Nitrospira nitrificans]|uniref:NADH:ubiquinone reductase (non-electrogenic) n=1 Tax=Candidatus Nitrospira nitrificans TaxID=1742973 RepID=A0A0S4LNL6_9BACT|nr:NAD(P)/FAD-dependent oxidoreductase [Candidatus Nitrospira nitrificans]CUS39116.1 NADH dehydrogenase [Candidatus Nitrospira nitrificans]